MEQTVLTIGTLAVVLSFLYWAMRELSTQNKRILEQVKDAQPDVKGIIKEVGELFNPRVEQAAPTPNAYGQEDLVPTFPDVEYDSWLNGEAKMPTSGGWSANDQRPDDMRVQPQQQRQPHQEP